MNIAPYIAERQHTFNSVCAYDCDVLRDVPIDGFGVELIVAHHGGSFSNDSELVSRHEGGVAVLRMTATQARKVRDDLSRILDSEDAQLRGSDDEPCPSCGGPTDPDWFCSEGYCPACCQEHDLVETGHDET